jgi:hypothetical protein
MKKVYTISALLLCATAGSFAQKQSEVLPYNKERLDSLFRSFPKLNQPFVLPAPKQYSLPEDLFSENPKSFEATHPGATVINHTTRGTIYNMPLDNMPVLVPDMKTVENMPGSSPRYKPAPRSNMPNPLYPGILPKKKKE